MKKLLTSTLAFVLVASMGVTAFAADNTATNNGTAGTDITVNGKYQAGAPAADVISVDIAWDAMDFTYTAPSKGTWNPETHTYENSTEGAWTPTSGTDPKITLTNHSNTAVKANFGFNSGVSGLNGSFTNDTLTLATADGTEVTNAPKGETSFSVSGSGIDASKSLGTVIVMVSKDTTQYVATAEEYVAAIAKGGTVKLTDDIEYHNWNFSFASDVVIDLNGKTLGAWFSQFENLTLKNGTINLGDNPIYNNYGSLTVKDCTINGGYNGITINNTDDISKIILSGNINLENSGFSDYGTVTCLAGTYNFDPTEYVDVTAYDVTNNGTTWTVAAK